jgi:hypothetical protein
MVGEAGPEAIVPIPDVIRSNPGMHPATHLAHHLVDYLCNGGISRMATGGVTDYRQTIARPTMGGQPAPSAPGYIAHIQQMATGGTTPDYQVDGTAANKAYMANRSTSVGPGSYVNGKHYDYIPGGLDLTNVKAPQQLIASGSAPSNRMALGGVEPGFGASRTGAHEHPHIGGMATGGVAFGPQHEPPRMAEGGVIRPGQVINHPTVGMLPHGTAVVPIHEDGSPKSEVGGKPVDDHIKALLQHPDFQAALHGVTGNKSLFASGGDMNHPGNAQPDLHSLFSKLNDIDSKIQAMESRKRRG